MALFVRDVTGLTVRDEGVNPPRLEGRLPDHADLLGGEQRVAAQTAWPGWWCGVVAHEVRMHQGPDPGVDPGVWLRGVVQEQERLFDRSNSAGEAASGLGPDAGLGPEAGPGPEAARALRQAVRALFDEAARWANDTCRTHLTPPMGRPAHFDYRITKDAAEDVAHRRGVDIDAVRACAVILPVAGTWWRRFAPGAVVCSLHAAHDATTSRAILADAFESGLGR